MSPYCATGARYLENTNVQLSPHLLYLQDLALCDFWLLLTLEKRFHSCLFVSNNMVINKVYTFFNSLPKAELKKTIKNGLKEWNSTPQMRVSILRKQELRNLIVNWKIAINKNCFSRIFICERSL